MRTFVLGDININKQKLEKRIKTRTKKLVKFFGEEYREFIEKKIGKTTFIVTERNSESLSSENEMENIIKNFLKSYLGDFIKYLPVEDLKRNSLYNDKFVLEIIDNLLYEKNFSVKNNIEFRALLIAFIQKRGGGYGIPMLFDEWIKANFNNPDYIKSLEEYLEQIGIDKIEDALFLSKNIWDTDLKKEYKIAKANFYETYFSKLKFRLNDNEILCTEELEKQFGKKLEKLFLMKIILQIQTLQKFV